MSDETYSFEQARVRLEEIATQVKRKDTSLEKSLDLLEEGVRLANLATEQIDHTQWRVPANEESAEEPAEEAASDVDADADAGDAQSSEPADEAPQADGETAGPDSEA
jgi:exodeoxyribonuclease VII small subunit